MFTYIKFHIFDGDKSQYLFIRVLLAAKEIENYNLCSKPLLYKTQDGFLPRKNPIEYYLHQYRWGIYVEVEI